MLPRRQQSGKRMRLPHDPRPVVTSRQAILGALSIVFFLWIYFNYSFVSRTPTFDASTARSRFDPIKKISNTKNTKQLSNTLDFETRAVQHIVFTSSCSDLDFVHSEVLAHSARATGYKRNITHLAYGCSDEEFEHLKARKNPMNQVLTLSYPEFPSEPFVPVKDEALAPNWFGAGVLATTIHPLVIQKWFQQYIEGVIKADEFLMVVENDAIYTKHVDVWNLYREVDDIVDPRWFGQDGAWYIPKQFPLKRGDLASIVPSIRMKGTSPACQIEDWRPYAATGPYVMEVGILQTILPSVVHIWSKLSADQRHLAIPIAAAHHELPIGISGVLTIHHYPSRYENWDFADDVQTNPCNETATVEDIELPSFPITLRAHNFTLPQWIDGKMWSFFDRQIPSDFFTCDGWLLAQPSGQLWHLASTTQGYERVPTILRRRHTISVCLALHAYNKAAIAYKTHSCPMGFNVNKKIPMEFKGGIWSSALALTVNTAMEDSILYGEYQTKEEVANALTVQPGQLKSDSIRFVFVTLCSATDQWHSDVLAHSFAQVGQRGRLTRIVCGCSDQALRQVLKRSALYPHLDLFATKSFSVKPEHATTNDPYVGYNRPFGIREWLRRANPPIYEEVVVFLTSDFIFMRPISVNSGYRITRAKDVDSENYKEHAEVILGLRQYKRFFVYEGTRTVESVTDTVKNGVAIAQRWTSSMQAIGFDTPEMTKDNLKVCPSCHITADDAREYYSVGPPYIMTKYDLSNILDDYCSMTVLKRELNRDDMAESLALVLASAKHKIQYTKFDNLALGGNTDEYWGFIKMIKENPCLDPIEPMILATAPLLIHTTNVYEALDGHGNKWTYDATLVPDNIFTCDVWMLAVPPASVWDEAKDSRDYKRMEQAYGVCTSIKLVNQAITGQRQLTCPNGFNENRKLRLIRPRPADQLKIGQVDKAWEAAATLLTK